METPYIMPLGFVERTTQDGALIMLTRPKESVTLKPGTPVTAWRYSRRHLALAKARGKISEVGYTSATVTTLETWTDSRWPLKEAILIRKTPVYLAVPDSFEPDLSQMITQDDTDAFDRLAEQRTQVRRLPEETISLQPYLNQPFGSESDRKHYKGKLNT